MPSEPTLTIEDRDKWRDLMLGAPQATRFLLPEFLDMFDVPVDLYAWRLKGVPQMGTAVIDAARYGGRFLPFCYSQGIFFSRELSRAGLCKRIQYEVEQTEAMMTALADNTAHFDLCLHPSLQDVRGFDWVHYHDAGKPRLDIRPRYTAVIELGPDALHQVRRAARSARRQEEGYATARENLEITLHGSVERLVENFGLTFEKQGRMADPAEIELMRRFIAFLRETGAPNLLVEVVDPKGVAQASAFMFEDFDGTWHVPFVGVGQTRYGGTLLYFALIDEVVRVGGRRIDFDGANSPSRSYFKHSFAARPCLYFEISWKAPAMAVA